ncbi:GAF domain-containing sensor histidine kinase [Portibacter lacus]|uniref:GAF domain-containing sensor histidine kinase n=1 Tax=Portibacter lacus TaxID=1099794 RepID=UPI001F355BEB|nr:HAMP domain-containing sensor histidine kinase [Portibacter lacus]
MKILTTNNYQKLLNQIANLKNSNDQGLNSIDKLSTTISELEVISSEYHLIKLFYETVKKLEKQNSDFSVLSLGIAKFFRNKLDCQGIIVGYKKDDILTDSGVSLSKELGKTKQYLKKFLEIHEDESFVNSFFKSDEDHFLWSSDEFNVINEKFWSDNYSQVIIADNLKRRIEDYINYTNEIKNILIIPIREGKEEDMIGYVILFNFPFDKLKSIYRIFNTLSSFLNLLYKINLRFKQSYVDYEFLSNLSSKYFESSLQVIFEQMARIIPISYASFWIPTIEENDDCFVLKSTYSSLLDKEKVERLKSSNLYKSKATVLREICDFDNFMTNYDENYIYLENQDETSSGFTYFDDIGSNSLLIYPIYKYFNEDRHEEKVSTLGAFIFYIRKTSQVSLHQKNRISKLFEKISFNIEHNLYDMRYHQIETLVKEFSELDSFKITDDFDIICDKIRKTIRSEHVSIFFANPRNELYLGASTSERFRNVDRVTKQIVSYHNVAEFKNNPNKPIYINDDSLTYRSYKANNAVVCHEVHSQSVVSNTTFCEATTSHHESLMIIPLRIENDVIGVLRIVNKIHGKDSILHTFTANDVYIGTLSAKLAVSYIIKSQYLLKQKLFIDSLAHENRTPIQIIELAIFNIQCIMDSGQIPQRLQADLNTNFKNVVSYTSLLSNNFKNLNSIINFEKDSKNSYSYECIDLKSKIEDVIELMRPIVNQRENKQISFKLVINKMPTFYLDEDKMTQVIYNIISNAIRYSYNSTTVEVYYKELKKGGLEFSEIKFENYGHGIEEFERDLVFRDYYRSENAKKEVPEGTGIGLPVTKKILSDMGCSIEISKLNNPTIFSIFIPLTKKCKND